MLMPQNDFLVPQNDFLVDVSKGLQALEAWNTQVGMQYSSVNSIGCSVSSLLTHSFITLFCYFPYTQ